MRLSIIIFLLFFCPLITLGNEYKIGEYRRYGSYNYLELLNTSEGGESFNHIMSLIDPNHKDFSIRILSPLTKSARTEIMSYYEKHLPAELKLALNSSGNLHNPALNPLIEKFVDAFKVTTLFEQYETTINGKGYVVSEIGLEKFTMSNGGLFVAEITLKCKKTPNKAN